MGCIHSKAVEEKEGLNKTKATQPVVGVAVPISSEVVPEGQFLFRCDNVVVTRDNGKACYPLTPGDRHASLSTSSALAEAFTSELEGLGRSVLAPVTNSSGLVLTHVHLEYPGQYTSKIFDILVSTPL